MKGSVDKNICSVGLDLGSSSLKTIAIEKTSQGAKLLSFNIKDRLPEKEKKLTDQIQELFKEIKLRPTAMNISVPGQDTIVRFVDFPKMEKKDLANALSFEAEKYIPFDLDQVYMDHVILSEDEKTGQMKVLLAAAKKDPVDQLLRVAQKLDIIIGVIDSDPFATFNAFSYLNDLSGGVGYAFLDMGDAHVDILLSDGGEPGLIRQVKVGMADFRKAISKKLSVPETKAAQLLFNMPKDHKNDLGQVFRPVIASLVKEVKMSLSYFENKHSCVVENVFVSGGLSNQKDILQLIQTALDSELKVWDPFEKVELSKKVAREEVQYVSSQLAVSLGLALRD